jgi:recombination protein RecR
MKFPFSIQNLIEHFSNLPTVGPKTAERFVFYLLKSNPEELQKFAQGIAELKEKTTVCQTCFSYAEKNPCDICSDDKRDQAALCVVADTRDMISIEATKQYSGQYHILGGELNAILGIKPEQLNINQLLEKINPSAPLKASQVKEIILALNPNLEGETTSMYLAKILKPFNLKITRLAKGLPMGSDLEYADEMTLANALKFRNEI